LILWGTAKVFISLGTVLKGEDWFEKNASRVKFASDSFAQALEWLVKSGASSFKGLEKTAEVARKGAEFEKLWGAGKYVEALALISGYQQAAIEKLDKAGLPIPFASQKTGGIPALPAAPPSASPDNAIGPNDPAQ
jgi:hypothetical protein